MAPTYEQWLMNVRNVLSQIADREMQERRWRTPAHAWERPEELINSIDDVVYDGYVKEFSCQWTAEQVDAAKSFQSSFDAYCEQSPDRLDPEQVLADPAWHRVQAAAEHFMQCFPYPSAE
jgi:hypothetical protein